MPYLSNLDVRRLARKLHKDQKDLGGEDYWWHLYRVADNLGRLWCNSSDVELQAAILHDAIEDTEATEQFLLDKNVNPQVIEIVKLLTLPETRDKNYLCYIQDIIDSGNVSAIKIKFCDNLDNTDPFRPKKLDRKTLSYWQDRYFPARLMLCKAILDLDVNYDR